MPTLQSILHTSRILGARTILRLRQARRINRNTVRGYYATQAIKTLFEVGLFDELAKQPSVDLVTFATRNNLDHRVLNTICDYLYELKILGRVGNEYNLDADGKVIYETMRGAYILLGAYGEIFSNLTALARREKTYGIDVHRCPELVAVGSSAVGRILAFPMLASEIRRRQHCRILDLGCGDATFLVDLCTADPALTAVGMDLASEAILMGQKRLEEAGLSERVQLYTGDIFQIEKMVPYFQGVEVVTFVYVLHEFQERIVTVLQRLRSALPGMALLICEVIRHAPEELRQKPGGVSEIQFFHELSNQRLYTRSEWRALFASAGYTQVEENYLEFVRTSLFYIR